MARKAWKVKYGAQRELSFGPISVVQINDLLRELSPMAWPLNLSSLATLQDETFTFFAQERVSERIIGMGALVEVHTWTTNMGYIHDVVVAADWRGEGIGRTIVERLILEAKNRQLQWVELTSRPDRGAANVLYQSLGFALRDTNCYRLAL